ncbi:WhiB family transcriptional regulator [Streptomyces sp. NBC_01754]|uniref:WhiB family transcriptional regulator n=1 Tax=Streptomyces sp. NBC_01754 TaxID=2975930 RepID=UPI002DDB9B5D|nr:WhiB family transcriptional regulator [Streptomyces sp. NBC_01754]WSC92974.1 WhiB family transcriptional regulator [Streptomyces sp. NBC_01754]
MHTTPTTPWYQSAACTDLDLDTFYSAKSATTAVATCKACPVRQACLDAALDEERSSTAPYRHGIRGGTGPDARHRMYKNRARQATADTEAVAAPPKPPSPYRAKLNDAQRADIRARYEAGGTLAGLARTYSVSAPTIRRTVKDILRVPPTGCGTTGGYRAHRSRGEDACRPCKAAHADADRRLRTTGTSKRLAAG